MEYRDIFEVLKSGDIDEWEKLAQELQDFPEGVDDLVHRRWIINAIDSGSSACVHWMIKRGVDLGFRDEEGYTPLHAAIESSKDNKYELLQLLLSAAAPVNLKGINDWTPAHMAAARDDVKALRLLVHFGADLSIRTEIDEYATPLEEAQNLGMSNAAAYLETVV
jgi:ankyrin repeat protein